MSVLNSYSQNKLSAPFSKWVEDTQTSFEDFKEILKKAAANSDNTGEWWNKVPRLEVDGSTEVWLHVDKNTLLYWDLDCYYSWTGEDDALSISSNFEEFAVMNMNQIEVSYA